jgi:hypothetical protein
MASKSKGVWVDTRTGKVVEKEPEQGVQIVAPDTEVTPAVQEQIDRAKDNVGDYETATAPAVETATTPKKRAAKKASR